MAVSVDYVVRETASNLWRNRLMTLAAILTVAVSLSLVGSALLLKEGVQRAAGVWRGNVQLIVFLEPTVSASEVKAVASELSSDPEVRHFSFVNQKEAYKQFKQLFASQQDLVKVVSPADLPPSFRVTLTNAKDAPAVGATFAGQVGVKQVSYDRAGVETMLKVTGVLQDVIVGMAVVLLLSAAMLILNTIRMAIYGRRREVAVMKLVGATNWFIRVPFMLEGLVQGLLGALIAAAALFGVRAGVQSLIVRFKINLLSSVVVPYHEAILTQLLVLLMGAIVGAVGSAFAVRRFLDV